MQDIKDGDQLLIDDASGRMTIHRIAGDYEAFLPVSFRDLLDYFAWVERNARFLPPQMVATVRLLQRP